MVKPTKVIFDTNVFNELFNENNNDPAIKYIYGKISDNTIDPYISETIFTIEGIQRKQRKSVLSEQKGKIKTDTKFVGREINMQFTIGPEKESCVDLSEHHKMRLTAARALNFKILCIPRIAGFNNPELKELYGEMIIANIGTGTEMLGECSRYIENTLSAGKHVIDEYLNDRYSGENFVKNIEKLKDDAGVGQNKIAELMGEWADGDSIAVAVAHDIDFFCTNDRARSFGKDSIFSESKRAAIEGRYAIRIVNPECLALAIQCRQGEL